MLHIKRQVAKSMWICDRRRVIKDYEKLTGIFAASNYLNPLLILFDEDCKHVSVAPGKKKKLNIQF